LQALNSIPCVSISPSRACFYSEPIKRFGSEFSRNRALANLKDNKHKGEISAKSSKRVKDVVTWMAYAEKRQVLSDAHVQRGKGVKLCLLTLTLPSKQVHSDKLIKSQALNQFLTELREKYKVVYYTWKAEKQANGNIHFHLVIDRGIAWQDLRNAWNRIISKMGYVQAYSEKFSKMSFSDYSQYRIEQGSCDSVKSLRAYNQGLADGWASPNSIDIHRVRDVVNMSAYLSKYVGKKIERVMPDKPLEDVPALIKAYERQCLKVLAENEAARAEKSNGIEGRIWSCSQMLSRLRSYSTLDCGKFYRYFKKAVNELGLFVRVDDYSTTIMLDHRFWDSAISLKLERLLQEYASLKFNPPDKVLAHAPVKVVRPMLSQLSFYYPSSFYGFV
jgi:hypothetical protein